MSKEIKLIYQDCAFCGDRKSYGDKQMAIAKKAGFTIRRLAFNELGAPGLIKKAVAQGVDRMPFFTDGERFSYDLNDFVDELKAQKNPKQQAEMQAATEARVTSTRKRAARAQKRTSKNELDQEA